MCHCIRSIIRRISRPRRPIQRHTECTRFGCFGCFSQIDPFTFIILTGNPFLQRILPLRTSSSTVQSHCESWQCKDPLT